MKVTRVTFMYAIAFQPLPYEQGLFPMIQKEFLCNMRKGEW
jgi:hypothetical protein